MKTTVAISVLKLWVASSLSDLNLVQNYIQKVSEGKSEKLAEIIINASPVINQKPREFEWLWKMFLQSYPNKNSLEKIANNVAAFSGHARSLL